MRGAPQAALRPPSEVMRLAQMGAAHPTRLSFIPALLRELRGGRWTFARTMWEMDSRGVGVGVYRARNPEGVFSLIGFGHDLPPERRSDRVIAEAWDATFVLREGEPSAADIARLRANVPLQEAGRCGPDELVLSRANKSARAFEHLVESVRRGASPDRGLLESVGYLMRTTAVYGNGKFGLADRDPVLRPQTRPPFRAEMLAVWLIRAFTFDWAEHCAGGRISSEIKRALGVGNSTGLGMAPFLVNHPVLLHQWTLARETALARVRAAKVSADCARGFVGALEVARRNAEKWTTTDARQAGRVEVLRGELREAVEFARAGFESWEAVWEWGAGLSAEGREALAAAMIEPHGDLVDDLAETMDADEEAYFEIDGAEELRETRGRIERVYDWALADGFARDDARFWYVSEEKLEPRLGERREEAGAEWELPLATAREVFDFHCAVCKRPPHETLAGFLARFPRFRGAARRLGIAEKFAYAEIRENLAGGEMIPVDMLRFKLAFFGASRFDPKSDRWLRISLFADAPLPCCFDGGEGGEGGEGCAGCPFRNGDKRIGEGA